MLTETILAKAFPSIPAATRKMIVTASASARERHNINIEPRLDLVEEHLNALAHHSNVTTVGIETDGGTWVRQACMRAMS